MPRIELPIAIMRLALARRTPVRGEDFNVIARLDDHQDAGLVPQAIAASEKARLKEE
jgi:hypothetical protein